MYYILMIAGYPFSVYSNEESALKAGKSNSDVGFTDGEDKEWIEFSIVCIEEGQDIQNGTTKDYEFLYVPESNTR